MFTSASKMNKGWASYMDNSNGSREFFFTKHNAKTKGPHLNMIQRTLKNWPGKNFKVFFLTEIKVQSFEKVKLLDAWGVWFVFLNNHFQFLNNISRISMHFFTHTDFYKYFQIIIFNF